MLVFCCGMMRSGSTVQYQIATELIESQNLGMSIGWISQFNAVAAKILEDAARRDDKTIVLKTHHYTPEAASLHQRGLAKMIYSYRDLRDVVVSLGRQFYTSPEEVLSGSTLSRLLKNDYSWHQLPDILVSRYENIVNRLPEEVLKIADYLNIDLTTQQAANIADKFSLERQRERVSQIHSTDTDTRDTSTQNSTPKNSNTQKHDPVSQLHPGHISSAATGQWQTVLSAAQATEIENAALSWLVSRGYLAAPSPQEGTTDEAAVFDRIFAGDQLCHQCRWMEAAQAYQSAIRSGSRLPKVHHSLGQVYFHQGRFLSAVNAYQHASALAPNNISYACDLGSAWARAGEYGPAASIYRQVMAIQPQARLPRLGLAEVLKAQGKVKESNKILKILTEEQNAFGEGGLL